MIILAGALAACTPWEPSDLPADAPTSPVVQAGFVTNGGVPLGGLTVRARGLYGEAVQSGTATADSAGRFSIPMQDLSPTYLFEGGGLVAVAADTTANVNITPFTTMQTTVLAAADPAQFFEGIAQGGPDGNPVVKRMTAAAIAAAQNTVLEVMREDASFTFDNDTMDFVRRPFKLGEGDPMAIALTSFNNTFGDASAFFPLLTNEGKKCRSERVFAVVTGIIRTFCPALKANLPDDSDPSVVVYGFTSSRSDSLQVRVRGGGVTSVTFTRHDEPAPYRCTDAACTGVALGDVAADRTRTITFDSTMVVRDDGSNVHAALDGNLLAPSEGPPRPPDIACSEGTIRVIAHFDDGNERQGCNAGTTGVAIVGGITSTQIDAFDDDGNGFSVGLRTRGSEVLSVALSDPTTGGLFLCRPPDCGNVSTTAVGEDSSFTITLGGVTMPGVLTDGTPSGGPAVTLTADVPFTAFVAAPVDRCPVPGPDTLAVTIDGEPTIFCPGEGGSFAFDFSGVGDTTYVTNCTGSCGDLTVVANSGVVSLLFLNMSFQDSYINADPAFTGITTSGPDGNGLLTVSFSNVQIRDLEPFGIAGIRTGTIDGTVPGYTFLAQDAARAALSRLDHTISGRHTGARR